MPRVADIVLNDGHDQEISGPTLADREWTASMVRLFLQRRRPHRNPTHPSVHRQPKYIRGEAHLGPPSRSICVILRLLEGPEPESPTLLLTSLVNTFLDVLYAGIVSSRGVFVIAVNVVIGSIRPEVVANLVMRKF